MNKKDWTYKKFEDCIEKVKYTTKIQSVDYGVQGKYPVVSQEEELISGYWDNDADVFHITKPVVIFGDHTRVLKYVDFDFVLGADGVKILQPTEEINAKFLLYYLIWYKVPSLGYSRHYKLLKELSIPVPPLTTQRAIVAELDTLNEILDKKRQQLKELDTLAQSIFYDMFGDPVENEKGWEVKKFSKCFSLKSGDGLTAKQMNGGCYPVYGGNGITGYHSEYNIDGNNIIIGRVGALCGNVKNVAGKVFVTDNAFVTTLLEKFDNIFVLQLLSMLNLRNYAREALQPVVSNTTLKNINIVLPPLFLQQSFAQKIEAIEKQKELINASIKEAQLLFDARMDYWFGE